MISQITGTIQSFSENLLVVQTTGLSYEVQIPTAVMKGLNSRLSRDATISLVTFHYHQTDPSKSIPILIGFANRVEREFFEKFITVSGVGPKAAVRALSMPLPEIAQAIDAGDVAYLKSLPGVGEQRAREIVAKLQGKMGKFGLIQADGGTSSEPVKSDIQDEALEVLLQLQYKKDEAKEMIRKAFQRSPKLQTVEEVLNEVYRQKKLGAPPKK
jgi:Holliday junction DNA helicase RuvA